LALMLALATLTVGPSAAQALTATSALIRVPTAHLGPDGLVTVSGGVLHPKDVPLEGEQHHVGTYAAAVTFLPFLELGFRFNKKFGAVDALGDRMVIARVRLVKEGSLRPAVVVG